MKNQASAKEEKEEMPEKGAKRPARSFIPPLLTRCLRRGLQYKNSFWRGFNTSPKGAGFILTAFFILSCSLCLLTMPSSLWGEEQNREFPEEAPARRYVLENGLVVIIKEVHSQPVVALEAYVRTGSAWESEFVGSGISHFVEHMLFKGTAKRGLGEIKKEISSYGGDIGGFTGKDYTGYSIVVPKEHLAATVDLLADALINPSFDNSEVEKERQVILKEINLNRDDPSHCLQQAFWSNAYLIHPYRHPIIGYEPLFKKITRGDLVNYHRRMYVPDNIIISLAGDVDTESALSRIKEVFKPLERRPPAPYELPREPKQVNTRRAEIDFAVSQAYLLIGFHTVNITDDDLYPLDVLAIVLGQGESSRLNQNLRKEKKLVYSVSAGNYTPKYPGAFFISALADAAHREEAVEAMLSETDKLKQEPVSEEELEKAKRMVLSQYIFSQQTVEAQARELAVNELFAGDIHFSRRYVRGVNSVNTEDIKRVARKYLTRDNLTVTMLVPSGFEKDTAALKNSKQIQDIERITLDNGLTLLLKEDRTLPMVSVKAVFKGGVRYEDAANNGITNLMVNMLTKGTKNRNAAQIAELIESLGSELSVYNGNNSFGVSMSLLAQDLGRGLELLSDILINPVFPEQEIALEKDRIVSVLDTAEDDIFEVSSQLLRKTLFKTHPYRFDPRGDRKILQGLGRSELLDFQRRFCTADNMVLAIFGDIDREKTQNEVSRFFQMSKSPSGQKEVVPEEPKQAEIREEIKYLPKQQAVLKIGFHSVDIYDADRYVFEVITALLSYGQGRIYAHIRDELGLAYTLGAYSVGGIDPGYYVFYTATTPANLELVKEKLWEEIELLETVPVDSGELARAKKYLKGSHKINLETSAALAFQSSLDELYGLGYDDYRKYEARIDSVSAEDIMRVAGKYFDLNSYALVVVGAKK